MPELAGICPSLPTVFTPKGAVDLKAMEGLAARVASAGARGLVLFDRSAETARLSPDELKEIQQAAAGGAGSLPVIVAIREQTQEHALQRAREAATHGAEAVLLAPPWTLPPESRLNLGHFTSVQREIGIPVVLDLPLRPPESPEDPAGTADELAQLKNLAMARVEMMPTGPVVSALRERTEGRVSILSGNFGLHIMDALDRGVTGITTLCSICELFVGIWKYYELKVPEEAERLYEELLPLLVLVMQSPSMTAACEKLLLVRRGWISSDACRSPSFEPDARNRSELFRHFEKLDKHLHPA